MLTRKDVLEMRALTQRIQHGSVSREDWANLAALTLIFQGDQAVAAIAAEGFDRFVAVSAPHYEGHAFQPDDYRRIYARICVAASRGQQSRTVH